MDLERMHVAIVEGMATPVMACDLAGRLRYANPAGEGLCGCTHESLDGLPCRDLLPDFPDLPLPAEPTHLTEFSSRVTVSPGAVRPVRVTLWPMHDGEAVCGYGMMLEDLRDYRELLAALRESETRTRILAEHMLNGLAEYRVVVDDEGRPVDAIFCEVNAAFETITGIRREAVVGMRVTEVRPDVDREWVELIGQVALTGAPVRFERHSERLGKWFAMLAFSPREGYCAIVSEDITERKGVLLALGESEEKFRTLFNDASDGIFIRSAAGAFLEVNEPLCRRLGQDRETLLRTVPENVYGPLFGEVLTLRLGEAAAEAPVVFEANETGADAVARPVEMSVRPISYGGEPAHLAVVRDISERRRIESAQRMAALGQLAAGVAHEFNNLLAAMMMKAELAALEQRAEGFAELVEQVLRSCRRGGEICGNMIAFAEPGAPHREPLLIEHAIEAALAMTARQMAAAGIALVRDYRTDDEQVMADPEQMEQVFLNLFINACHAMPHGGTLELETGYHGSDLVITIRDTGVGIPEEALPHIFEPFFTTKGRLGHSELPGTGLGLSVSHGIIRAHGGSITARSECGHGSQFTLRLPIWREDATAPQPSPPAVAAETTGVGHRVLVAEDEADVCGLLAQVLRGHGYEVVVAADTQQALEALEAGPFNLIVADWLMPGGGGSEVTARARLLPNCPPVIVITGKPGLELDPALQPNVVRCLRKPFHLTELLDTIESTIR